MLTCLPNLITDLKLPLAVSHHPLTVHLPLAVNFSLAVDLSLTVIRPLLLPRSRLSNLSRLHNSSHLLNLHLVTIWCLSRSCMSSICGSNDATQNGEREEEGEFRNTGILNFEIWELEIGIRIWSVSLDIWDLGIWNSGLTGRRS